MIETIVSSCIILFILSSSFLVINSSLLNSVVTEKKVQLFEQLNSKINNYILTGAFEGTAISNRKFYQVKASSPYLAKFKGKDSNFDITVSKEVIKYNDKS